MQIARKSAQDSKIDTDKSKKNKTIPPKNWNPLIIITYEYILHSNQDSSHVPCGVLWPHMRTKHMSTCARLEHAAHRRAWCRLERLASQLHAGPSLRED